MLTNHVMISRSMVGVANEPFPCVGVRVIRIAPSGIARRANRDHVLNTSWRRKKKLILIKKIQANPKNKGCPTPSIMCARHPVSVSEMHSFNPITEFAEVINQPTPKKMAEIIVNIKFDFLFI